MAEPTTRHIKTKAQMYELYNSGLLGNGFQNYSTLDECLTNVKSSLVGARCRHVSGPCIALKTPDKLRADMDAVYAEGCWTENDFTFGPSPDHQGRTMQGEVQRSENHFDLTYTTVRDAMRPALAKETKHATGLTAITILKHFMDVNTFEDVMELLDMFPGSVVEFTCFNHDVGRYPHRNTCIWEVRNY